VVHNGLGQKSRRVGEGPEDGARKQTGFQGVYSLILTLLVKSQKAQDMVRKSRDGAIFADYFSETVESRFCKMYLLQTSFNER
jgi:hypothetical protein